MQGEHPNSIDALARLNFERLEDKRALQTELVKDLISQFDGTKEFEGILPTIKRLNIPVGTLNFWFSDNDFLQLWIDYKFIRRIRLNDKLFRAIELGEGANMIAYIQGVLNRLDPEFSEKIQHQSVSAPTMHFTPNRQEKVTNAEISEN